MTSPRSRCEPGCAVVSVSIAVIRPSLTLNRTPSAHGIAAEPGVFTPPRVCHGATQSAITSANATAPALQSPDSANSVGECDTPVGLRTNNIAVGTTGGQDACVVAGLGRQHRDVAEVGQRTLQPCPRTRGKLDDRRDRFGGHPEFDTVGRGVLPRFGGDLVDQRPQRRLVGGPGIEPGVHRRRNRVGPVGRDDDLAERRDRVVGGGQRPRRVHRGCEREHRVVPVGQPGGACVVRLAAERELPAPVRPDGRRDGDRAVDADPARGPARRAVRRRRRRDRPAADRRRDARACGPPSSSPRPSVTPWMSRSPRAFSALNAPVDSWEPTHATPNRAPSSSEKATTATGTRGTTPRSRTMSMAAKADTTPSGPSNAPPSGTESRCEPVTNASVGSPDQPGGIHHAHRLPLRSSSTSMPRWAAQPENHSRKVRSASDQA